LGGETISSKISRPDLTEDSSLSDIKLGDPDASLFIPPPNYRVVEESNGFQIRIPQPLTPAAMQQFSHDPAPAAIPGAPFSGVKTKTITHALPDGTREKQPERTLFLTWRDSQGRVRTEWPGEGRLIEAVEIQDPIAGFVWSFDYAAKVARRSAFAASPGQNDPRQLAIARHAYYFRGSGERCEDHCCAGSWHRVSPGQAPHGRNGNLDSGQGRHYTSRKNLHFRRRRG